MCAHCHRVAAAPPVSMEFNAARTATSNTWRRLTMACETGSTGTTSSGKLLPSAVPASLLLAAPAANAAPRSRTRVAASATRRNWRSRNGSMDSAEPMNEAASTATVAWRACACTASIGLSVPLRDSDSDSMAALFLCCGALAERLLRPAFDLDLRTEPSLDILRNRSWRRFADRASFRSRSLAAEYSAWRRLVSSSSCLARSNCQRRSSTSDPRPSSTTQDRNSRPSVPMRFEVPPTSLSVAALALASSSASSYSSSSSHSPFSPLARDASPSRAAPGESTVAMRRCLSAPDDPTIVFTACNSARSTSTEWFPVAVASTTSTSVGIHDTRAARTAMPRSRRRSVENSWSVRTTTRSSRGSTRHHWRRFATDSGTSLANSDSRRSTRA